MNKQKEEAKGLVGKFKEDVKDLKSAWAKNLNIEDMMSFASPEEIIAYQNRKVELENEVQRRIRIVFKLNNFTSRLDRRTPLYSFTQFQNSAKDLANYSVQSTRSSQAESRTKKNWQMRR